VQEDIYGGSVAEEIAQNGESSDEGPAVGMQLGRSNIDFR